VATRGPAAPGITCPDCGYENRPGATHCNLCHKLFVEKKRRRPPPVPAPLDKVDFFAAQKANRVRSFFLAVGVAGLLLLCGWVFGEALGLGWGGLAVGFVLAVGMLVFANYGGSAAVLRMSGARPADRERDQKLVNVVEEVAIAAGLPAPRVFVIEDLSPNAFATGRDPRSAAVAVTRGLYQKLNREELQAVIAHEIGHVRNLDIRYGVMVAILVGVTALMCDGFLRGLRLGGGRGRSRSRGGGGGAMAFFLLAALILAILAPLVSRILQAAVSRQREFLADATSVELTRNPGALASALEKIAADPDPLEVANRATQHLYIVNPLKHFSMKAKGLLSTHPPTPARIQRLRAMGARMAGG
jgi:heat shock protein HtpX